MAIPSSALSSIASGLGGSKIIVDPSDESEEPLSLPPIQAPETSRVQTSIGDTPISFAPDGTPSQPSWDSQLRRIAQADQDEPLTQEQIVEKYPGLPLPPEWLSSAQFDVPIFPDWNAKTMSNAAVDEVTAQRDQLQKQDFGDAYRQVYPRQAIPSVPQAPQTSDSIVRNAIGAFANPLMLIAATAGALTKRPALNALAAATGVMEGLNERDWQKAYLQQHKFRNSVKETAHQTQLEIADVNTALNSGKPGAEILGNVAAIAEQHQDPFLSRLAKGGNLKDVYDWRDAHQKVADGLNKATRGYGKAQERLAEDGARLTKREQDRQRDLKEAVTDDRVKAIGEYREDPDIKNPYLMDKVRKEYPDYDQKKSPSGQRAAARAGVVTDPEDKKSLADAIEGGRIPPNALTKRQVGAVAPELENRGFSLSQATTEWNAAQRAIATLNSNQARRVLALSDSVVNTIDEAKRLTAQMDQGGVSLLNQAQLAALIRLEGNSAKGQLASRYLATMNTLKEEFANLAQGGYAPTLPVWELANKQINEGYGAAQNLAVLDQVQKLIRYRTNTLINQGGMLPGGGQSRYLPSGQGEVRSTLRPPTEAEHNEFEAAVRAGKPHNLLIERLQKLGIDPAGL